MILKKFRYCQYEHADYISTEICLDLSFFECVICCSMDATKTFTDKDIIESHINENSTRSYSYFLLNKILFNGWDAPKIPSLQKSDNTMYKNGWFKE